MALDPDERWYRNFEVSQKRAGLKLCAVEHMGGKCSICGYDKCLSALTFHHINPWDKDFEISSKMSWEAIVQELKKCALVCSNCHAEIHEGFHPLYLCEEVPSWD